MAKDCRGVLGRFRLWRELGGKVREIGGAIRGDKEVLGRFRAELEDRLRWQRVSLGKEHSEAVRGIESKAGEFYREGLEGSEKQDAACPTRHCRIAVCGNQGLRLGMRRCKLGATKPVPVSDSPVVGLLQVLSEEHGRISHAAKTQRVGSHC